jgi:hypothetical protein
MKIIFSNTQTLQLFSKNIKTEDIYTKVIKNAEQQDLDLRILRFWYLREWSARVNTKMQIFEIKSRE